MWDTVQGTILHISVVEVRHTKDEVHVSHITTVSVQDLLSPNMKILTFREVVPSIHQPNSI